MKLKRKQGEDTNKETTIILSIKGTVKLFPCLVNVKSIRINKCFMQRKKRRAVLSEDDLFSARHWMSK